MQPKFQPPKTDAEFKERATKVTIDGARSIKKTLEARRAAAVKPFDEEIKYWDRVIDYKQKVAEGQTDMFEADKNE